MRIIAHDRSVVTNDRRVVTNDRSVVTSDRSVVTLPLLYVVSRRVAHVIIEFHVDAVKQQ